ncbi:MAG: integral rane sensor signal transduction histidine kinase [Modestobacter sp.]|nr:integral rane sensor signal transduction histidine kinase [Modestobacter sp.]
MTGRSPRPVTGNPAAGGRYGSMGAVPTVARWWRSRSGPQRLDLYTRWSLHSFIGLTPLLTMLGLGWAATTGSPVLLGSYFLGTVAVAVVGVLLVRSGMGGEPRERPMPGRLLALGWGAALATATVGVLALRGGSQDVVAWSVTLPLGMLLVACSTTWQTRPLALVGAGVGVLVGIAELAAGQPPSAALVLALTFGTLVIGFAVSFRFSVWVLDLVREMEHTRGVQSQLAVAEERLRFSRDLHDVMGRNLSAIAVKSQLAGELVRRGRPEAADEVADVRRLAEDSLREVREVVRGHRSTDLTGELAGARSVLRAAGVACTVHGEDAGATLPPEAQTAFGWVTREAVTNVLRHSHATSCRITLHAAGGKAELEVVNDGVLDEVGTSDGRSGSGLTGLAERLAAAGGSLETRRDGAGFVLTASLPGRAR